MAKKRYFFTDKTFPCVLPEGEVEFWMSLGLKREKKYSEKYYFDTLKSSMSEPVPPPTQERLDEIEAENKWMNEEWEKRTDKEKESVAKNMLGSGIDEYKYIVNNYPPHVQNTAKLYFEIFQIPPLDIPSQYDDKSNFGYWCKDLEKIQAICGEYLVDCLVRAKRNYMNRHESDFKISHPGAIFKILKSALEEIESEREMLFVPEKTKSEETKKPSLTQMRNILEED